MSKSLISRIIDCDDVEITVKERAELIEIVAAAARHSGNISVNETATEIACEVKYTTTQNFSTVFTRRYKKKKIEASLKATCEEYLEGLDKKMIELNYDGSVRTRVIDLVIKETSSGRNTDIEVKFYSDHIDIIVAYKVYGDGNIKIFKLTHSIQ